MAQRKQTFILINDRVRENALLAIAAAGEGSAVTIGPKTRSGDQNAKFHAICTDIANSHMTWAGKRRDAEAWKVLLVSAHTVATKNDPGAPSPEIVPGLEGSRPDGRDLPQPFRCQQGQRACYSLRGFA
ncbi:recombination protein NinB [Sinorhizobium medicae]|uniref:recombination protein NinB n=1 Tax=Sinorhizobium medicae TaxID=110321 RepID=UPI0027DBABF6|nr:recombination protein NinB [Sinorhizobium medicae]